MPHRAELASDLAAELLRLYSSPHRRFHHVGHITDCLGHLDVVRDLVHDADALELALWFHDAIYVPGAHDNEQRSVELFQSAAGEVDNELTRRVTELILATKHGAAQRAGDCAFMIDIDLAGFGAPWDDFMQKGADLRDEYATQSDPDYYNAQVAFLNLLKQRAPFYSTDFFRQRLEATAQQNLRRLLDLRMQQGYGRPRGPNL